MSTNPAFQAAVEAHGFCDSWELMDDSDAGAVSFCCTCGKMSGTYPSYEAGERALDAHLDDDERALIAVTRRWWADQPDVPVHIQSYLGDVADKT